MMNEVFKDLSPTRIVTYILFLLSLIMLAITGFMAFNSFDVLDNWTLTVRDERIEAGEKVIIASEYDKKRAAGGEAVRYIECKNPDGVYLRYELNRRKANRVSGKGGTGIDVVVRSDIPDLPTTCKFSVSIEYDTFVPWYKHPEAQSTKEFTLYPKPATTQSDGSQRTSQTPSQGAVVESRSSSPQSSVSSSQSAPSTPTPQSNTSQEQQTNPPASQPGFIERILAPITNLLGGN